MNYYNEWDPHAAAWLRELIKQGLIPPGHVDERSISDVAPADLAGYTQCHFFAGIGGWSYALELAGWPEDEPVWTGSCPCQPFSIGNVAHGGGKGCADERHLLPTFINLVRECGPTVVFGEQVPNAVGKGWLDEAGNGFEGAGYAFASAVLSAKAFGANHLRERIVWVADSCREGRKGYQSVKRVPFAAAASLPINGDPLVGARRALAGDYSDLLPCDGLSVQLERDALKGFGNSIVPQVAAEFIKAFVEAIN